MHPVISDIDLSVRHYERDLEIKAVRRDSIARESARIAGRLSLVDRMVNSIRQFLDPRGYALSRVRNLEPAAIERGGSGPSARSATITGLPEAAGAESNWRDAA